MTVVDGAPMARNAQTAADTASGRMQAERDLGDDAERALRAHQQTRQVVARDDLRARVPVVMIEPSARTTVSARTFSRIVP